MTEYQKAQNSIKLLECSIIKPLIEAIGTLMSAQNNGYPSSTEQIVFNPSSFAVTATEQASGVYDAFYNNQGDELDIVWKLSQKWIIHQLKDILLDEYFNAENLSNYNNYNWGE